MSSMGSFIRRFGQANADAILAASEDLDRNEISVGEIPF
jgi:hypothetical protein